MTAGMAAATAPPQPPSNISRRDVPAALIESVPITRLASFLIQGAFAVSSSLRSLVEQLGEEGRIDHEIALLGVECGRRFG
jgi:hypothetical protein